MIELATSVLVDGLWFPEGPRWHDGRLWFSDVFERVVMAVNPDGTGLERVVDVPNIPSGLGWLPDPPTDSRPSAAGDPPLQGVSGSGRLLVVSTVDRKLLRLEPDGRLVQHADLMALTSDRCNDMIVDTQGRAYVGNWGFDTEARPPRAKTAEIVLVLPDGSARVAADGLAFPNGSIVTPDGRTLIVAESFAARLSAFDILADGSLANRRIWAQFDDKGFANPAGRIIPDGICLDAEGCVWVASPWSDEVLRVRPGGEITHRVTGTRHPFACVLGGADRRTLFVLTGMASREDDLSARGQGRVETVRVEVAGAGLP
jgi:sugar lactone lactonase YvrE